MKRAYTAGAQEDEVPPKTYNPRDQARRYSDSEDQLRATGGQRVNVRLDAPAVKAMRRIQKRHGVTQTDAIRLALKGEA